MGKLKFEFSLSVSTQYDFYNTKVEHMLKANDIWKKMKSNTGVIHVIEIFTELPCSSSSSSSSSSASSASSSG